MQSRQRSALGSRMPAAISRHLRTKVEASARDAGTPYPSEAGLRFERRRAPRLTDAERSARVSELTGVRRMFALGRMTSFSKDLSLIYTERLGRFIATLGIGP